MVTKLGGSEIVSTRSAWEAAALLTNGVPLHELSGGQVLTLDGP